MTSDITIRPEAVEAAAKAAHEVERVATLADEPDLDLSTWEEWGEIQGDYEGWPREKAIEFQCAAIAAFCKAEGLTMEQRRFYKRESIPTPNPQQRLVGKWHDV
jgi:hypothetical protein